MSGPTSPGRTTPRKVIVCFSLFMLITRSASTTRFWFPSTATTRPASVVVNDEDESAAPLPARVSAECSPSNVAAPPTFSFPGSESTPELALKVRAVDTSPAFDEVKLCATTIVTTSPTAAAL